MKHLKNNAWVKVFYSSIFTLGISLIGIMSSPTYTPDWVKVVMVVPFLLGVAAFIVSVFVFIWE
jgi:hypothetical protein